MPFGLQTLSPSPALLNGDHYQNSTVFQFICKIYRFSLLNFGKNVKSSLFYNSRSQTGVWEREGNAKRQSHPSHLFFCFSTSLHLFLEESGKCLSEER